MTDIPLSCTPLSLYGQDEGICLFLNLGGYRFLLDGGIPSSQVADRLVALAAVTPRNPLLHGVILSHAHPEQTQGLAQLLHLLPGVPLYTSEITLKLLTLETVPWIGGCQSVPWRSLVPLRADLTLELFPAGHIPGAAMALLTQTPTASNRLSRPYTVLYTGDCTLAHSRLVEGVPLADLRGLRPDVLIVDGTTGTARYGRRRQQELELLKALERSLQAGRSIVFPVPTWGMGQELLLFLKLHSPFAEQRLQIYIADRLIQGIEGYQTLLPTLPTALQNLARQQPLFWETDRFPRVQPWPESGEIDPQPILLLVGQGEDWTRYLPRLGGWEVWFPRMSEGAVEPLKPWMEPQIRSAFPPEAIVSGSAVQDALRSGQGKIQTYLFPDHCDGIATTQLIHNIRPQHVLFIGPDGDRLAELAALEELNSRYHVHLPALGQTTEFLVGETFFQPVSPDFTYEGELQEDAGGAWLPFPRDLTQDPRWQRLADTGVLQIRWQGDELILRGMSGRELVNQDLSQREPAARDTPTCGTCRHYRGQRCWNPASPLQRLKVSAEGFCLHHEDL